MQLVKSKKWATSKNHQKHTKDRLMNNHLISNKDSNNLSLMLKEELVEIRLLMIRWILTMINKMNNSKKKNLVLDLIKYVK